MSTVGVYHDECGGYHEYTGVFSTLGNIMSTPWVIMSTLEDTKMHVGVIMSTLGSVQYTRGIP